MENVPEMLISPEFETFNQRVTDLGFVVEARSSTPLTTASRNDVAEPSSSRPAEGDRYFRNRRIRIPVRRRSSLGAHLGAPYGMR